MNGVAGNLSYHLKSRPIWVSVCKYKYFYSENNGDGEKFNGVNIMIHEMFKTYVCAKRS